MLALLATGGGDITLTLYWHWSVELKQTFANNHGEGPGEGPYELRQCPNFMSTYCVGSMSVQQSALIVS